MIHLQQVLIVLLLLTLFLPLSFLSKKVSSFKFPFFIQMVSLLFIYFLISNDVNFSYNIIWWVFILYISMGFSSSNNIWEWWFIVLFIFIGLYSFLLGFITNFLGLFIILEAQVIVFLILTQFENNSILNIEAMARWCLLNIVSSLFLIMSFGILYQSFGTINLLELMLLDSHLENYTILGFSLFYASFLFKIGIPPLHFWLPDIYETSNLQLVSILVGPIKLFYIIVLQFFVIIQTSISPVFIYFGFISMLFALLITLNQVYIKRFLAWTGIFYFGAFLLVLSNLNIENIFYLKVYINIYLFSSILFVILTQINIIKLSDFMLLFSDNFLISLFFLATLMIMIGLPILSGFYGKLAFFYNLLSSQISYLIILILLTFTSFAGFYYLNNFIFGLSFKTLVQNNNILDIVTIKQNWVVFFLILFNLLLMMFPSTLSVLFIYII